MKSYVRFTAVLLAVCMLVGLAGCSVHSWTARFNTRGECGTSDEQAAAFKEANPDDVTATDVSGEQELGAGFYAACVLYTFDSLVSDGTLSQYTELKDQTVGEVPAEDYIDAEAQKMVKAYAVALRQLNKLGIAYNREDYPYYTYYAGSYENYADYYSANGVGLESFLMAAVDYNMVINMAYEAKYEKNGYAEVSDEELMSFYNSDFVRATIIQQSYVNSSGASMDDAEKLVVKTQFESYLSQFQAGTLNIEDIVTQYSDDDSDYTYGQSLALVYNDGEDETAAEVAAANVGEYKLTEKDDYIAIFRKDEVNYDNGAEFEQYRANILSYYKYDSFVDELASIADASGDIKLNNAVFRQLSIKKLPLDDYNA